jgi:hypothetical protein
MKLNKKLIGAAGLAIVTGMLMVPVDGETRGNRYGQGYGGGGQGAQFTSVANLPMEALSAEEEDGLVLMREEEKLARDVYQVLYEKWNNQIFTNIAQSEQQHMNAVKGLLDKYSLIDPITDSSVGVFTDHELGELYDSLVAQGQQSLVDAFLVGATIEDLDIKDLYDLIAETDNTDIKIVYQNLAKGSRNHLRAFTYQLSLLGESYEAQFLTAEQINTIISSPRERGRVDENGEQVSGSMGSGRQRGAMAGSRMLLSE